MKVLGSHFLLLCLCIVSTASYRILTILTLANKSNMNYFDVINLELAKRGHSITVISPTPVSVKHGNIQAIQGMDFTEIVKGLVKGPDFFQMRLSGERMGSLFLQGEKFASDCETFHQLPVIQNLIKEGGEKFDMVMTQAFMNECVYGLMHHLNTSTVIISTVPATPWFAGVTGAPTILSFVPQMYWTASSDMSFFERLGNVGTYLYQIACRRYFYNPAIEAVYQKYLPNAPGIDEIKRNVSLIMGAGHSSFGPLRPTMPDFIDDIGGIHCRKAEPLPKEIQAMITNDKGQETDFIFFSLGSIIQGHKIPAGLFSAFVNAFSKLRGYNVLWKWEADMNSTEESLPPNVKVSKWFPQQAVLGHARCKLFITHGGLSSVHEALYHNVPVVGIPFFGDQNWNMRQVEEAGIGVKLELSEITEELLTGVLNKVLTEQRYVRETEKRSKLFRDRQSTALETAVWWIEYVIRHGGATHLRSPARDLNIFQYYCVDLLAFVVLCFGISIYLICFVSRKLLSLVFTRRGKREKLN